MPAQLILYHELCQKISSTTSAVKVRSTSIERLALLVLGIIAAQDCDLCKIAQALFGLELTKASDADHIERRIQRILDDKSIKAKTFYEPVLRKVIDWNCVARDDRRVVLIVDESTKKDKVHLFRVSLAYRGAALPLAWATWPQNKKLPEGRYGMIISAVLGRVASLLPPGVEVVVTADRAYDNPHFVDRVIARSWHWIVRCKAKGTLRFLDHRGRESAVSSITKQHIHGPNKRWKAQGKVFKNAGWRDASLIGIWAQGQKEPLVVMTDLRCQWEVLYWYSRRFWTEPGFRNDKTRGWNWEKSQISKPEHTRRLLVAMAWATLVALCRGAEEAEERQEKLAERAARRKENNKTPAKPEHARESIFTMGLHRISQRLYGKDYRMLRWSLPEMDAVSWYQSWYKQQSLHYLY